jgi:hypothetical protein
MKVNIQNDIPIKVLRAAMEPKLVKFFFTKGKKKGKFIHLNGLNENDTPVIAN